MAKSAYSQSESPGVSTGGKIMMSTIALLLLPPPRRICNRRCLFICLSVC